MAYELVWVGGSILVGAWNSFIKHYRVSVDNLADARMAELKFREYLNNQNITMSIKDDEISLFVHNLFCVKYCLNKFTDFRKKNLELANKLLSETENIINEYDLNISNTDDESRKAFFERNKEQEINIYELILSSNETISESFVSLSSDTIKKKYSEEEARKYISLCNEIKQNL